MNNWFFQQHKLFEKEKLTQEVEHREKRLIDVNYRVPQKKTKYIVTFEDNLRTICNWLLANGATTIPQKKACAPSKDGEGGTIPIGKAFMCLKKVRKELVEKDCQRCLTEDNKNKQTMISEYLTF